MDEIDSSTAAVLREELDFVRDIAPGEYAAEVAGEFVALVQREERVLLEKYRVPPDPRGGGFMAEVNNPWYQDETRFAWIHTSQLGARDARLVEADPIVDYLRDIGLARTTRFDPLTGERDDWNWVGMHPHVVSVYSCALANRIAQANALTPVTHDPRLFASLVDIAARFQTTRVLTFDERHFRVIAPLWGAASFTLLPAER